MMAPWGQEGAGGPTLSTVVQTLMNKFERVGGGGYCR